MFAKVNCPASLAIAFASILPVVTLRSRRWAFLIGLLPAVQAFPRIDVPREEPNEAPLGKPVRAAAPGARGRGGGSPARTAGAAANSSTAAIRRECRVLIYGTLRHIM